MRNPMPRRTTTNAKKTQPTNKPTDKNTIPTTTASVTWATTFATRRAAATTRPSCGEATPFSVMSMTGAGGDGAMPTARARFSVSTFHSWNARRAEAARRRKREDDDLSLSQRPKKAPSVLEPGHDPDGTTDGASDEE
jgi:hypothetical protein